MSIRRPLKRLLSKAAWRAYNTYRKGLHYRSQLSQTTALLDARRETIQGFQAERLEKLLQHAYRTTPYYRELLKTESLDISQVPPLEKQNIRDDLERLCSEAFTSEQRIQNATGGSTGTPLTFYQGRDYWNQRNLSVYYFDRWAGWDLGEPPTRYLGVLQLIRIGNTASITSGEISIGSTDFTSRTKPCRQRLTEWIGTVHKQSFPIRPRFTNLLNFSMKTG